MPSCHDPRLAAGHVARLPRPTWPSQLSAPYMSFGGQRHALWRAICPPKHMHSSPRPLPAFQPPPSPVPPPPQPRDWRRAANRQLGPLQKLVDSLSARPARPARTAVDRLSSPIPGTPPAPAAISAVVWQGRLRALIRDTASVRAALAYL